MDNESKLNQKNTAENIRLKKLVREREKEITRLTGVVFKAEEHMKKADLSPREKYEKKEEHFQMGQSST